MKAQPKKGKASGVAVPYELTIGLSVLNDLGINLYSNFPAVLSEAVANSWDADADKVTIDFDVIKKVISISDTGCGMTKEEINEKYLNVGYKRREEGNGKTPKYGRQVMGRKGIGKLSLFSVADTIKVMSVKKDPHGRIIERNGFVMNSNGIKKSITAKETSYKPDPVLEKEIKIKEGTLIILSDLKKSPRKMEDRVKTRLARRFSIIGKEFNFSIKINGQEISAKDRDFFKKIEYLWTIGKVGDRYEKLCTKSKRHGKIDGVVDKDLGYKISGWVGTFDEQKSIEEGNNSIVIMARGKLIHEDILKDLKEGGVFTKYLIGEINADFVDLDAQPDMATSDRQNLKEDDPRFEKLKSYVQSQVLKEIQGRWLEWRKEDATEEALENKAVKEWFDQLGPDKRKYAQKLFGTIGALKIEDPEDKKELYRHGILAFEKLALKDMLSEIVNINTEADFTLLKSFFTGIDEIEAVEYYQIAKGRVDVLKKFEKLVPKSKERAIQEHIFNHLWLLDASWERASDDERMEEAVSKEFKAEAVTLTKEEKKGRLDIRYKTAAGKHIIVELKKYTVKTDINDLCKQVGKYRDALEKCLKKKFPNQHHEIEIVCVLGSPPLPEDQAQRNATQLRAYNARFITYDTLIQQTQKSYSQYLDKQKKVAKILDLVEKI